MKKYFLLIALFGFVFLWFGNSYASAATCDDINTNPQYVNYLRTGHQFTCEVDSPNNPKCWVATQSCPSQWSNCTAAWYKCCICDPDPTPAATPATTTPIAPVPEAWACLTPKWAVRSPITQLCSCPSGTKDVDGICKPCSDPNVCCWISLNTSVPFIGNCIEDNPNNVWPGEEKAVTGETAFPVLMWSLTKILVTVILILSFVLIIVWGIMISTGNRKWWMDMIMKVVIGIALLGASGVILRLINPNFFG
ncbi:MAG: hypothetical protein ACD_80C00131G0024 [uncultured bacterium (gcode 4)]|uniref:Uncharacterized protein n=1 Tax=uncultured bacterium (gcode 4) TaxID=1234023 RepID=K1XIJ0_9BACT|nr:MAG: hypothetical protein ACD_80C00131G0024 [uncultured bacterium (gcode 4)]